MSSSSWDFLSLSDVEINKILLKLEGQRAGEALSYVCDSFQGKKAHEALAAHEFFMKALFLLAVQASPYQEKAQQLFAMLVKQPCAKRVLAILAEDLLHG